MAIYEKVTGIKVGRGDWGTLYLEHGSRLRVLNDDLKTLRIDQRLQILIRDEAELLKRDWEEVTRLEMGADVDTPK